MPLKSRLYNIKDMNAPIELPCDADETWDDSTDGERIKQKKKKMPRLLVNKDTRK